MEPSVVMSLSILINITLTISDESSPSNLTEIDFELSEKIVHSSDNISETKEEDILDDFKEVFNSIELRIIYFSFWIIFMTLSNGFFVITILFEKYGEDIMKRSIDNQLWSQVAMAMILYNCVCVTIFLARFNYGPLYFAIAAFETYIANCWMSWGLLVLAELSVVKALSIYKFSWVVSVNEIFAGRFLLRFNLGYILISQTGRFVSKFLCNPNFIQIIFLVFSFFFNSRYFFGEYFETVHFQLLSGIKFSYGQRVYGPIYLSIILLTSVIAFVSTNIKKNKEKYKEWSFHQKINNNLKKQQAYEGKLPFKNIVRNNIPLFNGFEMAVMVGFVVAICITLLFLNMTTYDSKNFYKQFLLKEFTLISTYNIVMPVIYLTKKKKMRKYFWKYFTDAWSNTFY